MATELVCKEPFHAWGTTYEKGDVIDRDVAAKWPEGALKRRLTNGFLGYEDKETNLALGTADTASAIETAKAVSGVGIGGKK